MLYGIVQFPMVLVLFLNSYQRLSQTKEPFSELYAIIKIMSVHVGDKNWMQAVDEKQAISL